MKTKAQEWFLIKKNWIDWIDELSMEQRGELLTALYTKQLPEGLLGTLVKSHMEEFERVNDKREEGLAKRRAASKKGNEVKYNSTPSGNVDGIVSIPSLSRTKTKTDTNIDKSTKIDKSIDIVVKSNNKLTQEQRLEQFDKIFE